MPCRRSGRKFLLAGKGGLNLTHSEPFEPFASRYGARRAQIEPLLRQFDAQALREWAQGLGIATFVGTSGRVFPTDMKAAPLLRAWLQRLRGAGVQFHMRHRLHWLDAAGRLAVRSRRRASAWSSPRPWSWRLGGASWARLGSDGAWVPLLEQRGVSIAPLAPANCGFDVRGGWSEYFATPLRRAAVQVRRHSLPAVPPAGRVRRHRRRRRRQPHLCGLRAAARRNRGTRQRDVRARLAARPKRRAGPRRGRASARLALAVQPSQEPAEPGWHQDGAAA